MTHLPFPSNENSVSTGGITQASAKPPWKRAGAGDPPPIMFQVKFHNGRVVSYSYCDLREIRQRDAGFVQLCIYGMEKYRITIEGRHVTDLADQIGMGRIQSFIEMGPRTFERPEESPSIDTITVETLTGPAY